MIISSKSGSLRKQPLTIDHTLQAGYTLKKVPEVETISKSREEGVDEKGVQNTVRLSNLPFLLLVLVVKLLVQVDVELRSGRFGRSVKMGLWSL